MAEEKLLTIREVSAILGVSEKEVIELAETGKIPAYKIGGVYLRFKQEQIEKFRKSGGHSPKRMLHAEKYSLNERISDFFYFNDFYILAGLIVILMLIIIFHGY
ncbi:MAG: helix-turn-helix domain-containing protein [Candidatus Omnitrophica bacterium]|nr:helix-turn-helix domain-containing protein [Candidatus Omnitrophota bacterium]